jgi:hypothetical protein
MLRSTKEEGMRIRIARASDDWEVAHTLRPPVAEAVMTRPAVLARSEAAGEHVTEMSRWEVEVETLAELLARLPGWMAERNELGWNPQAIVEIDEEGPRILIYDDHIE